MIIESIQFYSDLEMRTVNGESVYPNNYAYSNVRAWLNGCDGSSYNVNNYAGKGFLDISFTAYEKDLINYTLVNNNSAGPLSGNFATTETTDKVYLLNYSEVTNTNYSFTSTTEANESRKAILSDYTRCNWCHMIDNQYGSWWLRSTYYDQSNKGTSARVVYNNGVVGNNDSGVNDTYYGVRPAITITLK